MTASRMFARLLIGLALLGAGSAIAAPVAKDGTLDLSQHDFTREANPLLRGEWKFYPSRWANELDGAHSVLEAVPGRWNAGDYKGYGTYVLKLTLPPAPEGERFAVNTGYTFSSYRLYANGALIAASGRPSARPEDEVARVYSMLAELPEGAQSVELRLANRIVPLMLGASRATQTPGVRYRGHTMHPALLSRLVVGMATHQFIYHLISYRVGDTIAMGTLPRLKTPSSTAIHRHGA